MRGLARAAKTNTPAIYRRFKNRKDILRALLLRKRREMYEGLASSSTLEEAFEHYLDFALRDPRGYELYYAHQYELLRHWRPGGAGQTEEVTPGFFWIQRKLAERFGGAPQDHLPLCLAIWSLAHGTASLLISRAMAEELAPQVRAASRKAFHALLREAEERGGARK
jgi:AcrR family transcriptional regulator